jgi:ABC-type uncharacterized transport system fused permease/ATPase subunit
MTSIVLVLSAVAQRPDGLVWNVIGYVVTVVLIVLLVQKELIRAYGSSRYEGWLRALDLAAWPFGLAFLVIVIVRLVEILSRP